MEEGRKRRRIEARREVMRRIARGRIRALLAALGVLGIALTVAACGGGDDGKSSSGGGGKKEIKLGAARIPISTTSSAPTP